MSEVAAEIPGQLPRQLPVLPLKGTVVFPGAMAPLSIGEERSIRLIDDVVDSTNRMVVLVAARDAEATEPGPDRKSTRLNSSHIQKSRMPSSA